MRNPRSNWPSIKARLPIANVSSSWRTPNRPSNKRIYRFDRNAAKLK